VKTSPMPKGVEHKMAPETVKMAPG